MSPGLKLLYMSTYTKEEGRVYTRYIFTHEEKGKFIWVHASIVTHLVFLRLSHVFLSGDAERENEIVPQKRQEINRETLPVLPDGPSEAVFQRRGPHVEDVDLRKPGVDASHLLNWSIKLMQDCTTIGKVLKCFFSCFVFVCGQGKTKFC